MSGLLWLILAETVAKHPARPTTTDVPTVFGGSRPIHCGFKGTSVFSNLLKSPKPPSSKKVPISNDITYGCFTRGVARVKTLHSMEMDPKTDGFDMATFENIFC